MRRLVWALGLVLAAPAAAQRSIPDAQVQSGTLSFDGHATAGDFTGTTTTVRGRLTGGPTIAAVRGWVDAPTSTLVTGNNRRDKDLNKSMESDKFPVIRFDLDSVTPSWERADSAAAVLHGRLDLHGVSRPRSLDSVILFGPDGTIRVTASFPVNLKDHRIGGLSKFLGVLKMHEDIEVHVDVVFTSAPGAPSP